MSQLCKIFAGSHFIAMQEPLIQSGTFKRTFCNKTTKINNILKIRDIIFLSDIASLFQNIGLQRVVAKSCYFPNCIFHMSFGKDNLAKKYFIITGII